MSAQEKALAELAGQAAFGTFCFTIGAMIALSGLVLIGAGLLLILGGLPLFILGVIVWSRAKWKARNLKGGSAPSMKQTHE